MHRPFPMLLVALTLSLAASRLPAQASPFASIADAPTRDALQRIVADAETRGLPTAPLVTKIREGLAKRATSERIRAATASLAERLAVASAAIAPVRSADELTAAADALQAGIPVATLRDMRRLAPERALTVPLGVLAELVASGVSKTVATRRVRDLLVKGATTTQFAALGSTVRDDIATGLAPDAAMELRSKGVMSLIESSGRAGVTSTPVRPPERH